MGFLDSLWTSFVQSPECAQYLARAKELQEESRARFVEDMKAKGRFTVSYTSAQGDTVSQLGEVLDWVGSRTVYRVQDQMTYNTVHTMDGPNLALGQNTYQGSYPQDRIDAIRAAMVQSHDQAVECAKRLNDQWASDGYPWSWG
jgi:hypothetical protein